jgi:hypothetical protein
MSKHLIEKQYDDTQTHDIKTMVFLPTFRAWQQTTPICWNNPVTLKQFLIIHHLNLKK